MTLRLLVRRPAWRSHIARLAGEVDGLVPVVKGNGYGFGRSVLAPIAAELSDEVCVGTVHELSGLPGGVRPIVLTPTLTPPAAHTSESDAVLTVGSIAHVDALSGWAGEVVVKLQSSMRRFGVTAEELPSLIEACRSAGLAVAGYALHLPLAGTDHDRITEVQQWMGHLPSGATLWLSHLAPSSFAALQREHPDHRLRLRVGTQLWHGDKSMLQLQADVLHVVPVSAGDRAGYRQVQVPADGHLAVVGAGSAHGVTAFADGSSPFHFARRRVPLVEPPHMHSSMVLVAEPPMPTIGAWVDVQRPLISTNVDELVWLS
jgi:alanine racemase